MSEAGKGEARGAAGGAPGDARRSAPAAARNREPIAAVLGRFLPASGLVLEVASGSGEHACHFAARMPGLVWQPSDRDPACLASIAAWAAEDPRPNLLPPVALDAAAPDWPVAAADAVVAINLLHVAPWRAGLSLLAGASRVLPPGGVLYLYGPFRRGGAFVSPGDAAFDADLRARDPALGLRDAEDVVSAAAEAGFGLVASVEMPANNLSLVFRRGPA